MTIYLNIIIKSFKKRETFLFQININRKSQILFPNIKSPIQMQIADYYICTIKDVNREDLYPQNKERFDKIRKEVLSLQTSDIDSITKKELITYMKRKMLCFYNRKIATEMLNLMGLDREDRIKKFEFLDAIFNGI